MQSRMPISLQLNADNQTWKRIFHLASTQNCAAEVMGPEEMIDPKGITWALRLRKENGEEVIGRSLCIHPLLGILLDATPINEGTLFLAATAHTESGEKTFTNGLGIGQFGSDITLLNQ